MLSRLRRLALPSILALGLVPAAWGQQTKVDVTELGTFLGWSIGCGCLRYNVKTVQRHLGSLFPQYTDRERDKLVKWMRWGKNEAGLYDNADQICSSACGAAGQLQFVEQINTTIELLADENRVTMQRANGLFDEARYDEAEPLYRDYLRDHDRRGASDTGLVALASNNLALLYSTQGRYAEAEPLFRRGLAVREKVYGPEHPAVAQSLADFASLYDEQGRYADAEALHRRALSIREAALGPDHPDVAASLGNLAGLDMIRGRYDAAEKGFRRAVAIMERSLGTDHPELAGILHNLARLLVDQGRYAEAAALHGRALVIREAAFGARHPIVGQSVASLALLYDVQGRYAEAEALHRRALTIWETSFGLDHPNVATTLNNLAYAFAIQRRFAEAEPLYERALALRETALGSEHPDVAGSLNNLAWIYERQARYEEADELYKRALAIREAKLGSAHPDVAGSLKNLASLYLKQARTKDAEPLLRRALTIRETALGPDHPAVADSLAKLAEMLVAERRYDEAERLQERAVALSERALGSNHPEVAIRLSELAELYRAQDRIDEALQSIRRSTAIFAARAEQASATLSARRLEEQASVRHVFLRHVALATHGIDGGAAVPPERLIESFEVGQLAKATSAAAAVARMGARFAAGNDALARVVRDRQDAVDRWRRLDARLVKAASEPPGKRDAKNEAQLRSELAALDQRIDALDVKLAAEFPEYAELASPKPVPLADVQGLLGPSEALMTYAVWTDSTFLWVVRRDREAFFNLDMGRQELDDAVTALRADLDPRGISSLKNAPPFDDTLAHELYRKLFAPAESLLEGARHVFVVPDAALQSLPLGVLVTEPPRGELTDFPSYRQVPWLARKYAMTVLPSVSSLRSLREFARAARAGKPFIGFGDPLLKGHPGAKRSVELAALFGRGAVADADAVRQLPALPETAGELAAMARALGAGGDSLFLRDRATERRVRSIDLADARVIAFATHGLVAGDMKGLAEPALVFTPPDEGSEEDDGLLTASEIATLKLDADWVILSACNTAAADGTPGAEGLSGLAKAFLYAGARALLVSHWAVVSDAAVDLTTGTLAELAESPAIGRAEALRRAMMKLIADDAKPHYAHPMFWAPFIVVGEGGVPAGRQ